MFCVTKKSTFQSNEAHYNHQIYFIQGKIKAVLERGDTLAYLYLDNQVLLERVYNDYKSEKCTELSEAMYC